MMNTDEILLNQFILGHQKEAAAALEKFEPAELAAFFNNSQMDLLSTLIPGINPQVMLNVFDLMKEEQVVLFFESLEPIQAELFIRMMSDSRAEQILNKLSSEKSLHIRRLVKYMKNWAGSLVEQTALTLHDDLTLKEALTQVKKHKSTIDPQLFILSHDRILKGMVHLSDLIRENPEKKVNQIMKTELTAISPETPVQSILDHPGWMDQYLLPVVENSKKFLGVIRLETIRKIQISAVRDKKDQNLNTINALGDLYQIGLAGLLRVATELNTSSD